MDQSLFTNQITFETIKDLIENNYTVPLLIDIDKIQNLINNFFSIQEVEQEQRILSYKKAVKLTNSVLANQMINACELFQKFIQVKPKMDWKDIQESIVTIVFQDLERLINSDQIPKQMSQNGTFIDRCIKFILLLVGSLKDCLKSVIDLLSHNEFDYTLFNPFLESIIENELGRICIKFKEFSFVQQADFIILYEKMKETVHMLVEDVQFFLFKMSLFSNKQMQLLDKLFEDNPGLINVRTFQTIQVEVAAYIVSQIEKYFLEESSFFWREEFMPFQLNFVRSSLVNFYCYSQQKLELVRIPKKTSDFQSCFQRLGIEFQHQVKWVQIMFNDQDGIQKIWDQTQIISVQSAVYKPNKQEGIILSTKDKQYFMANYEDIFIIFILNSTDLFQFDSQASQIESMTLQAYITEKVLTLNGPVDYNQTDSDGKIKQNSITSQMHHNIVFEVTELTFLDGKPVNQGDRMYPFKKLLKPQTQGTAQGPTGGGSSTDGVMANTMLAGGIIGAGIGMLIVDSLDNKMPWNIKLQRAGMSTLEGSAYGIIAIQMPVIGMLIAQTYLFLNIHSVWSNKVLNTTMKLKKIGHFGVQSGLGIGSAIVGQILIPIPFLGAIIGGTIGGISATLYGKFVVPNSRSSILNMMARIEKNQSESGEIIFSKDILDNMRISSKHLYGHKPKEMQLNHWLTLALVNLVNEVHYLFTLKTEQELEDIHKVLLETEDEQKHEKLRQKFINKELELEEVEIMSVKYEKSRYFLEQNNISILKNAFYVNNFVQGMISNFRI